MGLLMRGIAAAILILSVASALAACKSPPPHTDSTKGTGRSDTGMHDHPM